MYTQSFGFFLSLFLFIHIILTDPFLQNSAHYHIFVHWIKELAVCSHLVLSSAGVNIIKHFSSNTL